MCSVSRREAGARPMCPVSRHRAAAVVRTFTGSHQHQPGLRRCDDTQSSYQQQQQHNSTTAHSMMDGVSNSHSINRWINGLMARDSNCDKINVVKWPSGLCDDPDGVLMFVMIVRNVTAALSNVTILPSKPAVLFIFAILLYFAASKALFSSLLTSFFKHLDNWQWLEVIQSDILDHTYRLHMLPTRYISHVTSPSGSGQCHVPLNKYSDKPENI